jgi:hypothetical protein
LDISRTANQTLPIAAKRAGASDRSNECKCLLLLPGWAWHVLIRNAVLAGAFVNFLRLPQACQRE